MKEKTRSWGFLVLCLVLSACRLGEYEITSCDQDSDSDPSIECGGGDCDDHDALVSSMRKEICGDGLDNDCKNGIDDGCECRSEEEPRGCDEDDRGNAIMWPTGSPRGICKRGVQACSEGRWGICIGAVAPGLERCGNDTDDDCDGFLDGYFVSNDGRYDKFSLNQSCTVGYGVCKRSGKFVCTSDKSSIECNATAALPPGTPDLRYFKADMMTGSWDWDCNGVEEKVCCPKTGMDPVSKTTCSTDCIKTDYCSVMTGNVLVTAHPCSAVKYLKCGDRCGASARPVTCTGVSGGSMNCSCTFMGSESDAGVACF